MTMYSLTRVKTKNAVKPHSIIDNITIKLILFQVETVPGPLPLGVAVIDSSSKLFGLIFPRVAHKHRLQMLQHIHECIKSAKSSRQQAVQINIFTAVLCALKVRSTLKAQVKIVITVLYDQNINCNSIVKNMKGLMTSDKIIELLIY